MNSEYLLYADDKQIIRSIHSVAGTVLKWF